MQKIPTVFFFWNGSDVQFLLNGWRIEGPQDSLFIVLVFFIFEGIWLANRRSTGAKHPCHEEAGL